MPVSADRELSEWMAAPPPDGKALTIVAGGHVFQWWRKGRSHRDERELWRVASDESHVGASPKST